MSTPFTDWQASVMSIFVASAVLGVVLPVLLAFIVQSTRQLEVIVILVSLSIVGSVAGVAGGLSQEPSVGTIIPAFLGLLGGVAVYLFGADQSRGLITSFGAAALALSLIIGFIKGAEKRNYVVETVRARDVCVEAFLNADLMANDSAFERFNDAIGKKTCIPKILTWRTKKRS